MSCNPCDAPRHPVDRAAPKPGWRRVIAALSAALAALSSMPPCLALPDNPSIVAGQGDIALPKPGDAQITVNQRSDKLITHWDSFDLASHERIVFNQPSASAIALNRVLGTHGSKIHGHIVANGQVFLINPSGILFGPDARVDVGGLVAATQPITDHDFLNGSYQAGYRFGGASDASLINHGALSAADGGSIALLGTRVVNHGIIQARLGTVALGAGNRFTLSFDRNSLLRVQVDEATASALLAQNNGQLSANGGLVQMTTQGTLQALSAVVNNQGIIEAQTLSGRSGIISLDAGDGAAIVGGLLRASADGTAGDGGLIDLRGGKIEVKPGTRVETLASKGHRGMWHIRTRRIDINQNPDSEHAPTMLADTLSRNLSSTGITLTATHGDIRLNGPIDSNSAGAYLSLSALQSDPNSGSLGTIWIHHRLALKGPNAQLDLSAPGGHHLHDTGSVTLSGSGARLHINGERYRVIQTVEQLREIEADLSGRFALGADLCGSTCGAWFSMKPIGGATGVFTGTLEGLGNGFRNAHVIGHGSLGLFSRSAGMLRNLKLDHISISDSGHSGGATAIGALAGINRGTIINVRATNLQVRGSSLQPHVVGGLVGLNTGRLDQVRVAGSVSSGDATTALGGLAGENHGSITSSTSDVAVRANAMRPHVLSGSSSAGGLVGLMLGGSIVDSISLGAILGTHPGLYLGGLAGHSIGGGIFGSGAQGDVTGARAGYVGGLVGLNEDGAIRNAWAIGRVTACEGQATGGLIGANLGSSQIHNVVARGAVTDSFGSALGGLIGLNRQARDGAVHTAEASGAVTGGDNSVVGGLIGRSLGGSLDLAVAHGKVRGGGLSRVGGLIGAFAGRLANSSADGTVTGGNRSIIGGLVGENHGAIHVSVFSGQASGVCHTALGSLVGANHGGSLAGNRVIGPAGQLPWIGIDH